MAACLTYGGRSVSSTSTELPPPAEERSDATFGGDTLRYGVAVFAERLTGLILLPVLTSGLDKRDFGAWSQIQTAYGFFSTVLLLGFFHTVSGLVASRPRRDAGRIYAGV